MKKRVYKGCELESPTYRQVAADFLQTKDDEWCHYGPLVLLDLVLE